MDLDAVLQVFAVLVGSADAGVMLDRIEPASVMDLQGTQSSATIALDRANLAASLDGPQGIFGRAKFDIGHAQ